jgi:threonine/homoserine/homoserine lactone efflux protein
VGQAIGQVLALGVAVALSPVAIIAVVMMLATPQGRANGPAFVLGWIGGLAIVGTIVLVVSGGADAGRGGEPPDWVDLLRLALGALLLLVALKRWRRRPRADAEPELPGWMKTLDRFTATRAATFGVVLSVVNPKNLLLTVAAAVAVAQTGVAAGKEAVALAVFILIGSLGTGGAVLLYFATGERSTRRLDALKDWMADNDDTIMALICLLIGAKLLGDGLSGL